MGGTTTAAVRRRLAVLSGVVGLLLGLAGLAGLSLDRSDAAVLERAEAAVATGEVGEAGGALLSDSFAPFAPFADAARADAEAGSDAELLTFDTEPREVARAAEDDSWDGYRADVTFIEPEPESTPPHDPQRVIIPSIGVDASLVELGLAPDGSMITPDFGLAGWYIKGPAPGDDGPAVIVAHVDSVRGPDVFFNLRHLQPGDEIHVPSSDGRTATFVVESSEMQPKEALPVDRIWGKTDGPALRLITCGGNFNQARRSYESNVIVYASPA
jgi:hypothetical protein